ncbi:uncharacterized protein [Panulirus ornatus]|uniref:uncharacterized protein n=1 Tax=Panulirus ornatus TaxID=150431 RepID=UPI003A8586FF
MRQLVWLLVFGLAVVGAVSLSDDVPDDGPDDGCFDEWPDECTEMCPDECTEMCPDDESAALPDECCCRQPRRRRKDWCRGVLGRVLPSLPRVSLPQLLQGTVLGQVLADEASYGGLNQTRAPCSAGTMNLASLKVILTVPRRYWLTSPDLLTDLHLQYKLTNTRPSRLLRLLRRKKIFKRVKLFQELDDSQVPALLRNSTLTNLIGNLRFPSLGNHTLRTLRRHLHLPSDISTFQLRTKTLPDFWRRLENVTLSDIFVNLTGLGQSANLSLADYLQGRRPHDEVASQFNALLALPPSAVQLVANIGEFFKSLREAIMLPRLLP